MTATVAKRPQRQQKALTMPNLNLSRTLRAIRPASILLRETLLLLIVFSLLFII